MKKLVLLMALAAVVSGCGGHSLTSRGAPGVLLTFKVAPAPWSRVHSGDTERVAKIIKLRMSKLGATGYVKANEDEHTVVVRIDGGHVSPRERQLLGARAELDFFDLEPALIAPSVNASGAPVAHRSLATLRKKLSSRALPHDSLIVTCARPTATLCPGDPDGVPPAGKTDYYLFKYGRSAGRYGPFPNMTGADVDLAGTRQDFDSTTGEPIVLMKFKGDGNKKFQRITQNEAARGRAVGVAQHFAIVLDDKLRSWPQIDYRNLPNGIDPAGRGVQITGLSSLREARNVALDVQSGSLPVRLVLVSQRTVPS